MRWCAPPTRSPNACRVQSPEGAAQTTLRVSTRPSVAGGGAVIGLLQRVRRAEVDIGGETVAAIGPGLLVFVGVERGDGEAQADRLLQRLLSYRVFADADERMNRSLGDITGDLLLVPQFTLAANTDKGSRPSFTPAAPPEAGQRMFDYLCSAAAAQHRGQVATGRFGADMQVGLINDGPVTFWLQARAASHATGQTR